MRLEVHLVVDEWSVQHWAVVSESINCTEDAHGLAQDHVVEEACPVGVHDDDFLLELVEQVLALLGLHQDTDDFVLCLLELLAARQQFLQLLRLYFFLRVGRYFQFLEIKFILEALLN